MLDRTPADLPRSGTSAGHPIGAVMVVGGGIAGMQASLDLAEQGFKVYLVETKSAIGGHMAQLDKTFPTNDCAMCTISPKLVETGRHLNIEILTQTEVLGLDGEAGNFTARVRRKPRYIDPAKVRGLRRLRKGLPGRSAGRVQRRPRVAPRRLSPLSAGHPRRLCHREEGRRTLPRCLSCRAARPGLHRPHPRRRITPRRSASSRKTIRFPAFAGASAIIRANSPATVRWPMKRSTFARSSASLPTGPMRRDREPVQPVAADARAQRVAVIGAGPCGLTAAKDLVGSATASPCSKPCRSPAACCGSACPNIACRQRSSTARSRTSSIWASTCG